MKKTLLFCGLFATAAFNFMSCDDEDENNNGDNSTNNGGSTTSNLSGEFVGASDCLGSPYDTEGTRAGEGDQPAGTKLGYKFDKEKGEVELTLENLVLNCAATPKMDIRFSGDTIIFNAYNAGSEEANCICRYNLTSKVKGVESKVYYIRPERFTDAEDLQVLELSQKSEGAVYFKDPYGSQWLTNECNVEAPKLVSVEQEGYLVIEGPTLRKSSHGYGETSGVTEDSILKINKNFYITSFDEYVVKTDDSYSLLWSKTENGPWILGAPSVDVRNDDLGLQELESGREGYVFYVKQTNGECMSEAVKLVVVYMDIN
jgi:hypothetical protein